MSTAQNPVIFNATVSHTGTYQVIVTVNNCASAPATVSITVSSTCDTDGDGIPNGTDPDPTNPCIPTQTATPIAGTNGFPCVGGVFQLTANTFTGGVYSWTGPNGFTSTDQNPVIFNALASHAGVYTVTVTVINCTSSPASTTVVINSTCDTDGDDVPDDQDPDPTNPCIPTQTATPVASFTGFPCEGGTLQLTSNSFANGTYSWTGPNGFTSAAQNPMILSATAAANGVYSVTVTVNNCTSQADTVQISLSTTCDTDGDDVPDDVDPDPTNPCIPTPTTSPTISAGSSAVCIGSSVELYSLGANADSYSWTGPNSFTSSAQNPVILNATAFHSGMYYLTVTDHNCSSSPDSISVLVDQSSCDDGVVIPDGFSPNGDGVNDKFVIDGLENYPNNSVKIFNRWGNRLFEAASYANNWDGTTQFGVTMGGDTLPEGTYFYIITLDSTTVKTGYIYLTR